MIRMIPRAVGALALYVALAGCAGLGTLGAVATPTDLYLLTPKSTFSSNLPRLTQQVAVEEPTATSAVNTDQIAVQPTPFKVQYLPRARWVDRAPIFVQALLIESFENSNRVASVGRSGIGLRPDYIIVPDLREFQARVTQNATPDAPLEVWVRLNIKIVDAFEDEIIASRSFQRKVLSPSDSPDTLVRAFDQALGSTMRNAVEWSIIEMHRHAQSNPDPGLCCETGSGVAFRRL